jgi:hypothetical protein
MNKNQADLKHYLGQALNKLKTADHIGSEELRNLLRELIKEQVKNEDTRRPTRSVR